jgi:hypothetical protein
MSGIEPDNLFSEALWIGQRSVGSAIAECWPDAIHRSLDRVGATPRQRSLATTWGEKGSGSTPGSKKASILGEGADPFPGGGNAPHANQVAVLGMVTF